MRVPGVIDLASTLHGGQAFRWRREDDAWVGALGRRRVRFEQTRPGVVHAEGAPLADVTAFFRIEPADAQRRERLAKDPALVGPLAECNGLRLLRQDPWEATVAFITSANNNVPRIEGILDHLARKWGDDLDGARAFPDAARLARATLPQLRKAGLGYRAPFVQATARAVARGDVDLAALRGGPLEETREALLALPGVGPKVADCIALFSLDADAAFPIDRWILRAMSSAFFDGRDVTAREVEAFARARWGGDAGLAQQVLFHAVRTGGGAPGTARLKAGAPAA